MKALTNLAVLVSCLFTLTTLSCEEPFLAEENMPENQATQNKLAIVSGESPDGAQLAGRLDPWIVSGNLINPNRPTFLGTINEAHLPFRTNNVERMRITSSGNIGLGTMNPQGKLHLIGNNSDPLRVQPEAASLSQGVSFFHADGNRFGSFAAVNSASDFGSQTVLNDLAITNFSAGRIVFNVDNTAGTNAPTRMAILNNGNVGIGTTTPQGTLDVNGPIFQRGGQLHADYVFESEYTVEPIEEHAAFMWQHKHLKAIPKAHVDEDGREVVEVGAHRRGIVEELEKAHIYIEQLNERIQTLEKMMASLGGDLKNE